MSVVMSSKVTEFYECSSWPLGTRVQQTGAPGRVGCLVRRAAHLWVDRDTKPPMVRWDGKLDAVEIAWHQLERVRGDAAAWPR